MAQSKKGASMPKKLTMCPECGGTEIILLKTTFKSLQKRTKFEGFCVGSSMAQLCGKMFIWNSRTGELREKKVRGDAQNTTISRY